MYELILFIVGPWVLLHLLALAFLAYEDISYQPCTARPLDSKFDYMPLHEWESIRKQEKNNA